jgi:YVTN family beta-propeller protein
MRSRAARIALAAVGVLVLGVAATGGALAFSRIVAGPQGNGTGVTPNGWVLTPAGRQLDLTDQVWWADRPDGLALSPDGRTLLISSGGQSLVTMKVVDTATRTVRQTIPYPSPQALFIGVVWSPDGTRAFASAGGNNKVRTYGFDGTQLHEGASIPVPGFAAGLAISGDGRTLFVAENTGDALGIVDLATGGVTSVPVGPCDTTQLVAFQGGAPAQCQPYGVALSRDGATAYVSNWGEHSLTAVDVASHAVRAHIQVGTHPNAVLANPSRGSQELFVANGDSDTVSVVSTATNAVTRTFDLAPYAGAAEGSNPNALAVSPDGSTLFVANAGNNDVDVISLRGQDQREDGARGGSVLGMIPTAWYPTGISVSPNGRTLFIENAKGLGAGPNVNGPNPTVRGQLSSQYVASMAHGTLSFVATPGQDQLERYTRQVVENNGFDERDKVRVAGSDRSGGVVPRRVGGSSPIQHVIYVVKENRTYDQVLGSLGRGNGDPNLNLFDDSVATNIRALARQFVTIDNFYANAEVSADGWNWSTQANANTYVQKTWPVNYGGRQRSYDFEGGNLATAAGSVSQNSYLWDRFNAQGIGYRNYSFFTTSTPPVTTLPSLTAHTDPQYPGFTQGISDQARINEWEREFNQFVAGNSLPTVELVRLPDDHTSGTSPGAKTPKAFVADNDLALGRLVQDVSHSQFWRSTAIFVVEDDAQNGPDHVDAHRTEALVVSPYSRLGKVDSTFYSTVSMLRTMELIVGLRPLTQFDTAATPMLNSFSRRANFAPYTALVPAQSLTEVNAPTAPLAAQSAAMDFSAADAANEATLNEAIWKSVRGADSAMPAPRSSIGLGWEPSAPAPAAPSDGDGS